MKTWQTLIVSTLILAGAGSAVGVMVSLAPEPEKAVAAEATWQVESQRVEPGNFRPQIRLVGQVVAEHSQILTTPLASEITSLRVREGDRVEAGQLLLTLDDFDTRQRLQQIAADLTDIDARIQMQSLQHQLDKEALAVEEANLTRLRDRLRQQAQLVERGLAPQQQADELQQQVERQQLSVLQQRNAVDNHPSQLAQLNATRQKLQSSLNQAEREQSKTEVKAPFDGRVAKVNVSQGDRTQPSQPLLTLYSDNAMQLEVTLPTALAGREHELKAGLNQDDRYSELHFHRAEAALDSGRGGFRAWFTLADARGWLPGSYARVTLALPEIRSYRVPESAVFQDGWIYRIDDEQRLQARSVEVLGVNYDDDERWLIVRDDALADAFRLLTTPLNNPVTGMKVYEASVDPDPLEVEAPAETQS